MSFNLQNNIGLFVPTTNVWDIQNLEEGKDITPALKELLVRLYQNINAISLALNLKDSGYYVQQEFLTGQVFFPMLIIILMVASLSEQSLILELYQITRQVLWPME